MPNFLRWLPARSDPRDLVRLSVRRLRWSDAEQACSRWMNEIQPAINDWTPARVDRGWDWSNLVLPLVRYGGIARSAALYALSVGAEDRPAGLLALLERERWPLDDQQEAVFVWYLSTAPRSLLNVTSLGGQVVEPSMLGQAALDVALSVSRSQPRTEGRTWLHADRNGGPDLIRWYGVDAMGTRIPTETNPRLPGFLSRRARANDQRYFAWTEELTTWSLSRFDTLRGDVEDLQ